MLLSTTAEPKLYAGILFQQLGNKLSAGVANHIAALHPVFLNIGSDSHGALAIEPVDGSQTQTQTNIGNLAYFNSLTASGSDQHIFQRSNGATLLNGISDHYFYGI